MRTLWGEKEKKNFKRWIGQTITKYIVDHKETDQTRKKIKE